jgi:hypothetical protein
MTGNLQNVLFGTLKNQKEKLLSPNWNKNLPFFHLLGNARYMTEEYEQSERQSIVRMQLRRQWLKLENRRRRIYPNM